jgi:hypothetical protein
MAELAKNEMKANCAMPEWVGSNEGLATVFPVKLFLTF